MKTYSPQASDIKRHWHLLDANQKILGRLATDIASKLIGKHKPTITNHLDCGDYVVVINAGQIKTTGGKDHKKIYYRHTGFPGGLKQQTLAELQSKDPAKVIELAVKGMLPKNKLRDPRLRRLKIFTDDQHPYAAKFTSTQ